MSLRKILVLSILLAAGIAAFVWDQQRMAREKHAAAIGMRLMAASMDDVDRIELDRGPGDRIVLERGAKAWTMQEPLARRADFPAVKKLLIELERDATDDAFDAAGAFAKYGLDKPSAAFTLHAGKKESVHVDLGAVTPDGSSRYARRDNERRIFTIPAKVYDMATQDVAVYRDQRLLPLAPRNASSIEFDDGPRSVQLAQNQNPQEWKMNVADKDAGTSQACDIDLEFLPTFFIHFANTHPQRFIEDAKDNATSYGLTQPARVYRFTLFKDLGGETHSLKIGAPLPGGKERFAMQEGDDWGFALPEKEALALLPPVDAFQNKDLFHQDYAHIDNVTVIVRGKSMTLKRAPGMPWKLDGSPEKTLDDDKVENLVKSALGIKIVKILPSKPDPFESGLDKPNIELNIQSDNEKISETLQTGRGNADHDLVYARQMESDRYVMIDWREPGKFFIEPGELEETLLFKFDVAGAAELDLVDSGHTMVFKRDAAGNWTASPKGLNEKLPVTTTRMNEVVKTFTYLRWQVRLDPAVPEDKASIDANGLDNPKRGMRLLDAKGAEILNLAEGERTPRRVYVRRGENEYFAVDVLNYLQLPQAIGAVIEEMAATLEKTKGAAKEPARKTAPPTAAGPSPAPTATSEPTPNPTPNPAPTPPASPTRNLTPDTAATPMASPTPKPTASTVPTPSASPTPGPASTAPQSADASAAKSPFGPPAPLLH